MGFESIPLPLQIGLGVGPGRFTRLRLGLEQCLKLVAALGQIGEELIGLDLGLSLGLAGLDLERRQRGVHLVDPLLGPIEKEMHAALLWHGRLRCVVAIRIPELRLACVDLSQ
ncbi:hypothetical protein [Bradyrhizobium yuanmingense]|uniref:hypothetical protein n=1 Tax=Bradyrhizobium yuanmingense TaxID=108015 RepID=UPI001FEE433B|nr:hypothetical protein [Bradyrhizobium yuanmingense]